MWVGCIVTSQDHSFKAHFIAQAFDAKVDFSNDVCFSNVERDIVETDINSFISIITGNNHFLNFISRLDNAHFLDEWCQVFKATFKDRLQSLELSHIEIVKLCINNRAVCTC